MKTQKISIGYKTLTLQISRFSISDTDEQNSLTMAPHSPRMILPPLVRIQDLLALSTINLRSRWTVMTSFYPTPTPQNRTRWLLQTTWWIPLDIFDVPPSLFMVCATITPLLKGASARWKRKSDVHKPPQGGCAQVKILWRTSRNQMGRCCRNNELMVNWNVCNLGDFYDNLVTKKRVWSWTT